MYFLITKHHFQNANPILEILSSILLDFAHLKVGLVIEEKLEDNAVKEDE